MRHDRNGGGGVNLDATRLLALLDGHKGKAAAIKQAAAADSCGWRTPSGQPDTRRVQVALRYLRVDRGVLIASTCGHPYGMFVPVTDEEKAEFKNQIRSRARENYLVLEAADAAEARQLQRELGFAAAVPQPSPPESAPAVYVRERRDDIVYGRDGKPKRCWCRAVLRGDQTTACSDYHEQVRLAGRKAS